MGKCARESVTKSFALLTVRFPFRFRMCFGAGPNMFAFMVMGNCLLFAHDERSFALMSLA